MSASEMYPNPAKRLAELYATSPVMVDTGPESTLYPNTADGIVRQVEQQWLGNELNSPKITRHIDDGVLSIEKEGIEFPLRIMARTKDGVTCPIVWGISIEGRKPDGSEDILEPHILAPETSEVEIIIQSPNILSPEVMILGAYDKSSEQTGDPPQRTPLLERNGEAGFYEGRRVIIWDKFDKRHLPKASTAVKLEGGDFQTVESGTAESVLHGGIYLLIYPVDKKIVDTQDSFYLSAPPTNSNLKFGGGGINTKQLTLPPSRVATVSSGTSMGIGGITNDEPDYTKGATAVILRLRTIGDIPGYLSAAAVAADTTSSIIVKRALCSHCGANAPEVITKEIAEQPVSQQIYEWHGDEFKVVGDFSCGHCGGHQLEPAVYRKKIQPVA